MRAALLVLCCALASCATERPRHGRLTDGSRRHAFGRPGTAGSRGPLFASPMGEPFHGADGEARWFAGVDANGDKALTLAEFKADALRFFAVLDRNKDGEIDPDDMQWYETELFPELRVPSLGGNGAGANRMGGGRRGGMGGHGAGGRGGGGRAGGGVGTGGEGGDPSRDRQSTTNPAGRQGAGRFSYLDIPEPVSSADSNFNRGVSAAEFIAAAEQRFALLDRNHDGRLTLAELPSIRGSRARQM